MSFTAKEMYFNLVKYRVSFFYFILNWKYRYIYTISQVAHEALKHPR